MYKVGSLFAGVGGICQAFNEAGQDVVWANEIDSNACNTYRLNHKNVLLIEGDVKEISASSLGHIDILTAGFPCQPFSIAAHGTGFHDERGQLIFEVIRLINELKPKAIFLENVKTLATHDKGKTFIEIRRLMSESNYSFIPFILNAAECTDIPQGRERIYIVGFANEGKYSFEKPVKKNIYDNGSLNHYLSANFNIPVPKGDLSTNFLDFLESATVQESDYYNNKDNKIHNSIIEAVVNKDSVYQYRRNYIRENKSNVCPTLTASMGVGGHNVPIILDEGLPRRLTPKECFNLQGFPADFKLPANLARGQLYKQAGNSVVVPVVTKIAKELARVLNESSNSKS